ncbi:MAG: glycosyltransferase, partial [Candidatus Electryoneaceae bacterium]|nr:glycosyltransferase [Candidatus Electryoneaceae bacterium]
YEYENQNIRRDVFNNVDAIVVPSIWVENSPLVIHEALQARVPVITADVGGMREYVRHEVNGLLFKHRDVNSLAHQMQRLIDDPKYAIVMGQRGYLQSEDGNIISLDDHVNEIERIYLRLLPRTNQKSKVIHPGPWRITFDTNPDDCNLRCIMCEEHSQFNRLPPKTRSIKRIMDIDLIRQVLEDSRNTPLREIIPSTMGEPLLYEHFDEIIELCKEFGVKLNLTTNGTFPRKSAVKWAELIVPVASDVKISLNGASKATQEAIMVGSRWEKLLQNCMDFIAVRDSIAGKSGQRCRVTFQTTFMECNISEMPDMIKLAAELGVDRVKGHHVWVHFDDLREQSMRRNIASIARWNKIVTEVNEIAKRYRLPNGHKVMIENFYLLNDNATSELSPTATCPFLGMEAWINAEGRFDPCCAPDELRQTLGQFGNVRETSIREIWSGEDYQKLRATYLNYDLCRSCNMRQNGDEYEY